MPVVLDKPDHIRQRVAQEDADLVGEIPLAAKPLRKLRQQRVRRAGAVALALQKMQYIAVFQQDVHLRGAVDVH